MNRRFNGRRRQRRDRPAGRLTGALCRVARPAPRRSPDRQSLLRQPPRAAHGHADRRTAPGHRHAFSRFCRIRSFICAGDLWAPGRQGAARRNGAPGVNRRPGPGFRKPLLYPTELRGLLLGVGGLPISALTGLLPSALKAVSLRAHRQAGRPGKDARRAERRGHARPRLSVPQHAHAPLPADRPGQPPDQHRGPADPGSLALGRLIPLRIGAKNG